MTGNGGKVHVVRVRKTGYVDKQGRRKDYSSAYLRRTYRDGGTVKNETVANLSALPGHVIDLINAGLKGQQLVPAAGAVTITGSLPHGHAAAVHAMAAKLGLPALLGPAGRQRDLALALIISRVVAAASKLSTLTWWADTTLGADLGVAAATADDLYAAMDWLEHRQDAIEAGLARRHLAPEPNPAKMALFDLSSSWLEGTHCPLAARGYSRDGKKGKLQIEYGLLTDPEGRPVAVRVFPGNTGDPGAFTAIVDVIRKKFGLEQMVMVGDRGMITSARIDALNQAGDGTPQPDTYGWITALRPGHPQADGRRRAAPAQPLRPAGPGRDHLRGLPRRAADRLPQPGPGRRPGPNPRRPARRHREAARPPYRPGPGRPPAGRRRDRGRGRQGDHQVQDRQALFRGLLEHLATLTRNQVRYTGTQVTIAMLAEPTSAQRQAFELIGAPITLTLT